MGKWFGQANEIEELRAENRRLKEQVATLEARLRAAYADAGITALAGPSPTPEAAAPTAPPSTAAVPKAPSAGLELTSAELDLVAAGELFSAVKAYKDRTGVDLRTAKATIDAVR